MNTYCCCHFFLFYKFMFIRHDQVSTYWLAITITLLASWTSTHLFMHSLFHLLIRYLLSPYQVPGTDIGAGNSCFASLLTCAPLMSSPVWSCLQANSAPLWFLWSSHGLKACVYFLEFNFLFSLLCCGWANILVFFLCIVERSVYHRLGYLGSGKVSVVLLMLV